MPTFTKRSVLTKPPFGSVVVNDQHPLSMGLQACWLLNEGAGTKLVDIAANSFSDTVTDTSNTIWKNGVRGIGLSSKANAGTTLGVTVSPTRVTASSWSWDAWLAPTSSGDSYGAVLTQGTARGFWFRHALMKLDIFFSADHLNNTAITAGTTHHYAFTFDTRGGSNTGTFYLDGIPDGTLVAVAPTFSFDTMLNDALSETFDGICFGQRLWSRVLSGAEVLNAALEPYAFLTYRRPGTRLVVPSAPPPSTGAIPSQRLLVGVGR